MWARQRGRHPVHVICSLSDGCISHHLEKQHQYSLATGIVRSLAFSIRTSIRRKETNKVAVPQPSCCIRPSPREDESSATASLSPPSSIRNFVLRQVASPGQFVFWLVAFASWFSLLSCCEALTLTMGLLKVGKPKSWESSKGDLKYIRQAGVRQFVSTYNRVKDLRGNDLLWGDEIEYGVFHVDSENKKVRLSLRAKDIMDELNAREQQHKLMVEGCNWVPEYGSWMVEATPARPYTGYTTDLLRVERNMRLRRKRLLTALRDDEVAPTLSAYPMLGAQGNDGTVPKSMVGGDVTLSEYISDAIINPHPRFGTLTANIRQRRGELVNIRVPLFRDYNTPEYVSYEQPHSNIDGCCGSDSQQLWRYGKDYDTVEKYGRDYVVVGCSKSSTDEEYHDTESVDEGTSLQKWLVNVNCQGCLGLFYRRAPGEIVLDADWPRNGEVVIGTELQHTVPGWVRLQNGYYLPMHSEDGKIQFLHKIWSRNPGANGSSELSNGSNGEAAATKRIGSNMPLFRTSNGADAKDGGNGIAVGGVASVPSTATTESTFASLLDGKIELSTSAKPVSSSSLTATMSDSTATATLTKPPETKVVTGGEANAAPATASAATKPAENKRASIHMDAMAFGMGNCCLQVTFQARDIDESRFIYDQLAVMAPILMALTAATPIVKGRIADTDARWGIIAESVDDRTPAERGQKHLQDDNEEQYGSLNAKGRRRMYKSRYDSISTFIYQGGGGQCSGAGTDKRSGLENRVLNIYNDIPVPVDEETYQLLRKNGIDPALSQHVSHLFIRDPLVVFEGAVEELDDETQTEHWESIQSTNWQSVRWKPPPPRNSPNDPHIGWRTEFRTMELQLTDFENAAFTVFVVLLTRVILAFDLNLYIPLSRVDANMQRAHSRNAAAKGKFFFRRHAAPLEEGDDGYGVKYVSMFSRTPSTVSSSMSSFNTEVDGEAVSSTGNTNDNDDDGVSKQRRTAPCGTWAPSSSFEENSYEEMTMAEIMCGKGDYFPGLIPLIQAYLDHINCDSVTRNRIDTYLDLIERRSKGELLTTATWMRNYVRNHPAYKGDSVVNDEIAHDLMMACRDIGLGKMHVPELLGNVVKIEEITTDSAYDVKLESSRVQNEQLLGLLQRYRNRKSFNFNQKNAVLNGSSSEDVVNGPTDVP